MWDECARDPRPRSTAWPSARAGRVCAWSEAQACSASGAEASTSPGGSAATSATGSAACSAATSATGSAATSAGASAAAAVSAGASATTSATGSAATSAGASAAAAVSAAPATSADDLGDRLGSDLGDRLGSDVSGSCGVGRRLDGGLGRAGRGGGVGLLACEELPLPLGERLVDRHDTGVGLRLVPARTRHEAVGDGVRDDPGQQRDGADRVVVARDLVVDLVRVAVGVEDGDDRDVELARLVDREVLLLRVDDPDGAGHPGHVTDSAEGLLQLVLLPAQDEQLLLRHPGAGDVVEVEELQLLEALETLVDGLEVREHAAEPPLVDVGHADARRLLGDGLLGLLLRADEQDGAAVGDGLPDELVGTVDERQRLLQVDDVDAVALGEDEPLHLRVPPTGLVPEVDAALEQLAHGDDCHGEKTLLSAPPGVHRARAPVGSSRRPGGRRAWRLRSHRT